jgi:hypothetical protein
MPDTFRLLWIDIDEPEKSDADQGYIHYWIRQLDEAGLPAGEPRAHRIHWSELAAEAAEDALLAMSEGEQLNGRLSRNLLVNDDRPEAEEAQDSPAGDENVSGTGGGEIVIEFLRAPPRSLPAKPLPQ